MKNPVSQLASFLKQARRAQDPTSDYLLLASVDAKKNPHVRSVLIKSLDPNGIGFVTNATGPKNRQFQQSHRVEACIVWPSLALQVRVSGTLKKMPRGMVAKLWKLRPREAQILYSLGLQQSSVITSYEFLLQKVKALEKKWLTKKTIPLSSNYIGYLLVPQTIEFLHHHPSRLNRRELFVKRKGEWKFSFLAP